MSPEPTELRELREAVKRSYKMRPLPQLAGERKKKKTMVWRADPELVDQLVKAETEWRRALWQKRVSETS